MFRTSEHQKTGKRAILVDDHPIITDALTTALGSFGVFDSIDIEASLESARTRLENNRHYDLIILDLHLGDSEGIHSMEWMRETYPDIPVIIFSGEESAAIISKSFEHGVRGYIPKSSPMNVIISALKMVLLGGNYLPSQLINQKALTQPISVQDDSNPVSRLTPRQTEVFYQLLQGLSNKVIARRLDMAEGTVKAHLNTVYRVFDAENRAQVIIKAKTYGIID